MRLYTGKGDQGTTDLLGARVGKADPRIDILGELDEASASLGLARAHASQSRTRALLIDAQRDLYEVMAELAYTAELRPNSRAFSPNRTAWLEGETDALSADVPLPPQFVLPGESVPGAALDVARTVVRRAERVAVALGAGGQIENPEILRYLNRLSSLMFILARFEDREAGHDVRAGEGAPTLAVRACPAYTDGSGQRRRRRGEACEPGRRSRHRCQATTGVPGSTP